MKQSVVEGTWFAVPLRSGGFAVGAVARTAASGGVILAYFFRTVWEQLPSMDDVKHLDPDSAVRILRVGDLAIINEDWAVIGHDQDWHRDRWPVPRFVRRDDLSRRAWAVEYGDDANVVISETPIEYESTLERDAVLGTGAAEIVLTRTLSPAK
ncbi:Imm26 family immunity protein [Sorangium cellulosum]|uniref:Uncharacterized protein n=1 Tax=Sorangium cellulosum TaxID=56 RepID=A0A4P2QN11_SORCE|nr:uncharacterized protein SOCE836_035690 [Sorangium cellulosum]